MGDIQTRKNRPPMTSLSLASRIGGVKLSDVKFPTPNERLNHGDRAQVRMAPDPSGTRLSDVILTDEDSGFDIEAWGNPTAALDRSFDAFYGMITNTLRRGDCDAETLASVDAMLGLAGSHSLPRGLLASNRRIRKQGYELLFEHLSQVWEGPRGACRRWFFGTIFTDMGNALEYAPVFEIGRLKRIFWNAISRAHLNAVGFIEIQAANNYPQKGRGRTLMCHAHFIGYSDDPTFDAKNASALAQASASLTNWLGAPTVQIIAIPNRSMLKRRCSYLFKAPIKASYIYPSPTKRSGFETRHADVDTLLALRLSEALTELTYRSATFSTGSGKHLKGNWLRALAAWHRPRVAEAEHDAQKAFKAVWDAIKISIPRQQIEWRWNTSLPPCSGWRNAMSAHFAEIAGKSSRGP
jgi:hypothetical protein